MSTLMLVNPKKRKKRRKARKRRRNPIAKVNPKRRRKRSVKRRRTYRRNPARRGMMGIVQNTVMPAATAAAGAIGLDLIFGYLPLPDAMKTGPMRHLVKGAAAIGLGMLAQNFVKRSTAEAFTSGAMTIVMYNAGREMAGRFMPNLPLSAYVENDELGYYSAGFDPDANMMGLDLENNGLMAYDVEQDNAYAGGDMGYVDDDLEV